MATTMSTTILTEKELEQPAIDIKLLSETEKKELVDAETASITSGTTLGAPTSAPELAFKPSKSFHINAKGASVIRLPTPPKELVTTIHNFDGTSLTPTP
jgi:hypothetical protein